MSDIKLSKAELHTPLFVGTKSLKYKLDVNQTHGLQLKYDGKWLIVQYNADVALVPESNVISMEPTDNSVWKADLLKTETGRLKRGAPEVEGIPQIPVVMNKTPRKPPGAMSNAQVSTPQSHVFEPGKENPVTVKSPLK